MLLDLAPVIQMVKSGPASAVLGEEINFTFTLTNIGNVPLRNVTVGDDLQDVTISEQPSGDLDNDQVLDLAEIWVYNATYLVPVGAPNPLVNHGWAQADYQETPTRANDSHATTLNLAPGIHLEKTGPESATIGETITYTFNVTNTGNVPLSNVIVNDDLLNDDISGPETGDDGDDILELGETWNYSATYTIQPGAPNPVLNNATASGDYLENAATDSDDHVVTLDIAPAVNIAKYGPTSAHIGEEITYTFTLTNTGNVPLTNVKVNDPLFGGDGNVTGPDTGDDGDSVLELGEKWNYSATYTVPAGAPNPLVNTVTATGDYEDQTVHTDDFSVTLNLAPGIQLTKSGPASATIGEEITYTFTVRNTGNVPLSNVTVKDAILGGTGNVTGPDSGDNGDGVLDLDETWVYSAPYTIPPGAANPVPNMATARGDYQEVGTEDDDDFSLPLNIAPGINVAKEGPTSATIGETITYSFTLTNIGNVPLSNVTVNDPLIGGDGNVTGLDTGDDGDGILELTETWVYIALYTVPTDAPNPIPNTATARGDYHEMPATDSDDHTVSLNLAPGINVAKEGPTSATIGETITYSFTLTNIGNVPLSNVTVNDPLIGGDGNVTGPDTGDDGDGILELTETWVYIAPYTIPTDAPNPIPNTATARGDYQEMPATDSDDHTVSLNLAPGINVAKEGPVTAALGETITYTFTVTNIGNVPLRNVTVNDPLLGGDGNVTGPNTGDDGDGILEIGEVWNYSATYTVPDDSPTPLVNTATASGDYRGLSVSVTDVYTVALVVDPEITFAKFGPNTALVGEMVTYWFEVWNTGTVPLRNVTVKDAILGGTGNVTGPTSGDDDDGVLDVDEIWVYTATYEIPPGAQNPLINTATATADFREIPASGTANHAITLNTTPGINLVKDGPASASVGQTITYTFRVTNTGNVPLSHLVLSDPILGGTITGPASGDTGNDQVLGRDEVWVYTQTYTVPQGTSFPLRNVARIAADYAGMPVQDEDDHTVNYYPGPAPAMILVKSGPTSAYTGETITYTFRMTNSGSVPLTGVTLTDQMLGGTIVGPASGDLDHDQVLDLGETWIYTADYTVPAGAPDPLRNTAIARAIGGSTETLSSYSWDTRVLGPAPSSTNTLPTGTTTVTATSTVEPTETDTIEPTGTPTVNVTDTVQPTGTPTVNVTDTVQPTGTPTVNVTDTVQPTGTPTVNVTDTVQPTGTPTGNVTDTVQPTGTPTVNVTDTVQPTGTPTVNVTDTVEPTATMTVTVTATPTGTPTKTPTVTATKTPTQVKTPTLTVTPAKTPAPTKTATKTPTVTKTPTKTTVPTKTLATPSTPEGRPTTGKTTVPTTKATTAPGTWPTATDTTPGSGNPTETTGPSYPSTTEPSGPSDTTGPGFPTTTGPSGPSDTTRTRTPSTTGPAGGTTTGIPSVSPTAPQTISPWPSVTIPADLCPVLPGPTGPVTVIDRSTVIEAPGYYVLGTGVVNTTAAVWLDVRASDVTIDGMGRRIDGVDRTGSYGIRVRGDGPLTNVTIYNLTVTDFAYGIAFERVSKGLILHVDASSNTYDGIQVIGGHDNRIECSIIHRDDDGINLVATDNAVVKHNIITENVRGSGVHLSKGCNGATVLGNIIGANDEGIEVDGVSKALIRGNRIFGSRYYGLNLTTATDLSVVDNAFNNTANLRVPTGPFSGTWCQEPPMLGPNVMGNLYVGGNYWGTPNRTGFSDLTPDANGDGFVDEACTLPGGIGIDRYPLGPSLSVTGETGTPGPTGTNAGSGSDSDPYAGTPSGTDGTERPAASGRDGVIGPEATISGSIPASTVPGLPVPSGGIPASTTAPSPTPTPEPGILLALAACGLAAVFFSRRG